MIGRPNLAQLSVPCREAEPHSRPGRRCLPGPLRLARCCWCCLQFHAETKGSCVHIVILLLDHCDVQDCDHYSLESRLSTSCMTAAAFPSPNSSQTGTSSSALKPVPGSPQLTVAAHPSLRADCPSRLRMDSYLAHSSTYSSTIPPLLSLVLPGSVVDLAPIVIVPRDSALACHSASPHGQAPAQFQ